MIHINVIKIRNQKTITHSVSQTPQSFKNLKINLHHLNKDKMTYLSKCEDTIFFSLFQKIKKNKQISDIAKCHAPPIYKNYFLIELNDFRIKKANSLLILYINSTLVEIKLYDSKKYKIVYNTDLEYGYNDCNTYNNSEDLIEEILLLKAISNKTRNLINLIK